MGVNVENKKKIATCNGIPKLIHLAKTSKVSVMVEAVAALANLAVNGKIYLHKCHKYFLHYCVQNNL